MSGLGAGIPGGLGSGLPKGSLARKATDKIRGEVFGDDEKDEKRKRKRLQASPLTEGFAPAPNPLSLSQGL